MGIIDRSIKLPVTVTVGAILILLFGFISFFRVPVQLTPDVEKPKISVKTVWSGASPEEVEKGIILSVHAPYYINLASDEKEKFVASKKRILDACERAQAMGAQNVTFHAGFYQKRTHEETYQLIKTALLDLKKAVAHKRWQVRLCPEVTGKPSQFGSLEELLRLGQDTGCGLTVDFSHLYARQQGEIDYGRILDKLPKKFHAHFSGIEYGDKGERKHIRTTEKFFKPLFEILIL